MDSSTPAFAGVQDGTGTVADRTAQFGDPLTFERRSFLWNPATPSTFTEVDFVWEGTGSTPYAARGVASGLEAAGNHIFVSLERERISSLTPHNVVEVYDRKTLEWVADMTVGFGPRAIAVQN